MERLHWMTECAKRIVERYTPGADTETQARRLMPCTLGIDQIHVACGMLRRTEHGESGAQALYRAARVAAARKYGEEEA